MVEVGLIITMNMLLSASLPRPNSLRDIRASSFAHQRIPRHKQPFEPESYMQTSAYGPAPHNQDKTKH
jgi:hypothetical protein